jgi:aspartate/methionine/tyrosine aminotransferase
MMSPYVGLIEMCRKNPQLANFGIGSPNVEIPDFVKEAAVDAIQSPDCHQYARTQGAIGSVTELGKIFSRRMGRQIDPLTEIITCTGATGAYYNVLEAFVHPGDEVVMFVPMYPFFYPPVVNRGAKPVALNLLKTGKAHFDREEFKAAFSPKTRMLIVNTPQNPTGKVFTKEELTFIAEFVQKEYPNVLVVADEVYCDFIYGDKPHTYLASLPGMWNRTITLLSFGKPFNITGWRIGFAIGPKEIIKPMSSLQVFTMVNVAAPLVASVEKILKQAEQPYRGKANYYDWLKKFYKSRYLGIKEALQNSKLDFDVLDVEGGYTLIARIEKAVVGMPIKYFYADYATNDSKDTLKSFDAWLDLENPDFSPDFAFCYYLADKFGVVFYPLSGMTDKLLEKPKNKTCVNFIRAVLCRNDDSIAQLREKL